MQLMLRNKVCTLCYEINSSIDKIRFSAKKYFVIDFPFLITYNYSKLDVKFNAIENTYFLFLLQPISFSNMQTKFESGSY